MAYNNANALKTDRTGLYSSGELAQGNENATQNAQNVALVDSSGNAFTAANPIPVTLDAPAAGATFTDAATKTITLGGTSQQVFAANTARIYLFVLNTSDTIMYLQMGSAATSTSIPLNPNWGYFEPLVAPGQTVNILCATTGKTFVAISA